MAKKLFAKTYHDIFHELFPGISPCTCHQKIEFLIYDIDVTLGETVGAGKIIKMVKVKCEDCGKEETFDVENREVFEEDMNF